jgi:beta-galactosidase
MFFQFRASRSGAEKFHSAMLPHAGTDTRVWREVLALGHDLGQLESVRGSRVSAEVAIVWDWESFWAQDLEWGPSVDLTHRDAIEAVYSAFWRRGVTVDFVAPQADLSDYRLVFAPSLHLVSDATGAWLTDYVCGGGTLAVSYGSGLVDENDAVHPGGFPGPLREVLGLGIDELLPFADGETATLDTGGRGSIWSEDIRLTTATAITRFADGRAAGQPAVTVNRIGEGSAWYLATRPDAATFEALIGDLLAAAHVTGTRQPEGLEVVERASGDERFLFAINHAQTDARVDARGVELLSGDAVEGSLLVPGGGVRVVRLRG